MRIAFGFPSGIALTERIQLGIACYARERGGWDITRNTEMLGTSVEWLQNWPGDGAFVFAFTPKDAALAQRLGFPAVNLSSHLAMPSLPTVSTDHHAIGRLAAEYFLSKNFRRLAFYGPAGMHYSKERLRGFCEGAGKRAQVQQLLVPTLSDKKSRYYKQENALDHWLQKLERPVGILAASDPRANIVLEACRRLGLKVPRDVAVIGVDNDPLIYELSEPPLSSIARNDFEVGRQAAMLLESLIHKKARSTRWVMVPPEGIVERESTRTLAVDDPLIAQAVETIQNRISKPFGAEEIAAQAPISRRQFEARFCKAIGRTPYAFINHLRVERAKLLLEEADSPSMVEIAGACGFTSAARFRLVFKRTTRQLPSQWRGANLFLRKEPGGALELEQFSITTAQ